ncbi:hypothetical protein [uncultured Nostoc sp.]|uniref:hypothetical protein n=1 Tax=uncultured Nostoc sp. TaxID=340711 RepID=UPI00262A3298|nr:hypothetical protein [uncultured Nostoc sp.]
MSNVTRLLQDIKDNPVMYLEKLSITSLDSFLIGYLSTRSEMGLDREGSEIEGFQEWIQKREKTDVSQSWARILIFSCGSERNAFYSFFELFERFLKDDEGSKKDEKGRSLNYFGNDLIISVRPLYELLGSIKKRPGMYLGNNSITKLNMLLRGYSLAQREVGVLPTEQEREFEGFQSWIEEKYGINSGQSWSKIILFYSVDEHEALEKFFELFEEYLNRNKNLEVDENSG